MGPAARLTGAPHLEFVAFARRQSPDWAGLANDYRAGRAIDPARYVPAQAIPNFPDNIVALIAAWNARYALDFFSVRAFIASLSRQNLARVRGARHFSHHEETAIAALAAEHDILLFFYDDDDFFAGDMLARLQGRPEIEADSVVFPLPRIHNDLATFSPLTIEPDFVWGARRPFLYKYHTNNYGLHARLCRPEHLRAMKDHMDASDYAARLGFGHAELPFIVSATVKTPCSASMLHGLLTDEAGYDKDMVAFGEKFSKPTLPDDLAWLSQPVAQIAKLFEALARRRG